MDRCCCENSHCPHGYEFCDNTIDQNEYELLYLSGDPVCQACIDQMRLDLPSAVLKVIVD